MMDLDELKAINDRLGHYHGDRVLRAVGEVIASGVRRIDAAARYGGDEFVVAPARDRPDRRLRPGREDPPRRPRDAPRAARRGPPPSLSVGVVSYPDDGRTVDELMISADGAMYASKRAGKDRVTGMPTRLTRAS